MRVCEDYFEMAKSNVTNQIKKLEISDLECTMALLIQENGALREALKGVAKVNKYWQTFHTNERNFTVNRLALIAEEPKAISANRDAELMKAVTDGTELYAVPEEYESFTEVVEGKRAIQVQLENLQKCSETPWKEREQILQAQINSNRDDFNAEREEKLELLRVKKLQEEEIRHLRTELGVLRQRNYSRQPVHNICRHCHTISVNPERIIERRNSSPRLISRGADIFSDHDLVVDRSRTETSTPERTRCSPHEVSSTQDTPHSLQ